MLDCDKLHKNSSIEQVDYLYRHSMLSKDAELVYEIVEQEAEVDVLELNEVAVAKEELDDLKELTKQKLDSISKALDRIKGTLTEKQFAKIENDFDKVVEYLDDIEYEVY